MDSVGEVGFWQSGQSPSRLLHRNCSAACLAQASLWRWVTLSGMLCMWLRLSAGRSFFHAERRAAPRRPFTIGTCSTGWGAGVGGVSVSSVLLYSESLLYSVPSEASGPTSG